MPAPKTTCARCQTPRSITYIDWIHNPEGGMSGVCVRCPRTVKQRILRLTRQRSHR